MSVRFGRRQVLGAAILVVAALTPVSIAGLTLAAVVIDSPTSVTVRVSDSSAVVQWIAPVDTGGELVTGYTVTSQPDNQTCSTTGSPASTSCTVNGLTNGVAYTFSVVASTTSATSSPSAASTAATPIAGTTATNFLAANGAAMKWGSDYIWASDPRGGVAWPNYIYNYSSWSSTSVGTTVTAQEVNTVGNSSPGSCLNASKIWQWPQLLCDVSATRDNPSVVSKTDTNQGFTIDSVNNTSAFAVVDLGQVRSFTTLRIFQMFSDGKVTEAAIYRHPTATSATWPTVSDAGWVEVKRSKIGAGKKNADSSVTCPTLLDFSATTSRYVMFNFKNKGEFGNPSWIEVGGAKLFYETSVPSPESSCPPEPPTNATAVPGNGSATVSWTPAVGTVTSYSIQYSSNGGSNWTPATTSPSTIPSTATTATVTGLNNGSSYIFRVRAINTSGLSPYSSSTAAVTPTAGLPNPPQSVTATPLSFSALISWTAVSGATTYTVTSTPGSKTCTATAPDTSCIVSNLTAGLNYTFSVATSISNATSGQSIASAVVVPVSVLVPGAPAKPTTTVSGSSVTITVGPGQSGGAPDSYVVTATPGGLTCTVTGASGSCTISGLTPGQSYTFTTVATNIGGSGASSAASDSVNIASNTSTATTTVVPTTTPVTTTSTLAPTTSLKATSPTVSPTTSVTSVVTAVKTSVGRKNLPSTGTDASMLFILATSLMSAGAFLLQRRRSA